MEIIFLDCLKKMFQYLKELWKGHYQGQIYPIEVKVGLKYPKVKVKLF